MSQPQIHLHTYFRSSCSARVRIALYHKGLQFTPTPIHLLKSEQKTDEYIKLNPSGVVPTLTVKEADNNNNNTNSNSPPLVLQQSNAILEYLEECFPPPRYPSMLPPTEKINERARVRTLTSIIVADIQPLSNLKILKKVRRMAEDGGKNPDEWQQEWAVTTTMPGLKAYEELVQATAGKYSVGDEVTLADICLVPAVDNALRVGIDLEKEGLHNIKRISENLRQLDAFKKGGWRAQPDTPEEFREK